MIRNVVVVFGVLCSAAAAVADEAAARKQYEQAERAYNLGEFDEAVELFKSAYEGWPEPALLFNIAQTYRQMGDCKQALFFYKRFLALKQQDTKKPIRPELHTEVEQRIVELEDCMKRELASKPPNQLDNGSSGTAGTTPANASTTTATGPDGGGPADEPAEEPAADAAAGPSMLSARAVLGIGKLSAGDLDTKFQFAGAIAGGYPLAINEKIRLELGAALSFTPVPYTTTMDESASGSVIGIVANVAPAYEVAPNISVRADAGIGVQLFTGLTKEGNPFTEGGTAASGALTTLLVRTAVSGDYAINDNLVVTATPLAFSYSPAPSGFLASVSSLTTLSFGVGVGYRR